MNGRASTVREAVAAQVLGEVDDLVLRLENVARTIQGQESSHEARAAALLDAADKFKGAVTQFSEAATTQVREAVERHAHEVVTQTRAEAAAAMQEAARQAWRTSTMDEADRLAQRLRGLALQFKPLPYWQRLTESALGGFAGASLVVMLLFFAGKL
jgi:predicted DNA-binding protein